MSEKRIAVVPATRPIADHAPLIQSVVPEHAQVPFPVKAWWGRVQQTLGERDEQAPLWGLWAASGHVDEPSDVPECRYILGR